LEDYNEKRDEHFRDYDLQAEELIADLEFFESDTADEVELKFQLLDEYHCRLAERRKRHQLMREHQVFSQEKEGAREQPQALQRQTVLGFQEADKIRSHLTVQASLKAKSLELVRYRQQLEQPTLDRLFQAMADIRDGRSEHYRGCPSLKVHRLGLRLTEHQSSEGRTKLSDEEMRAELGNLRILRPPFGLAAIKEQR
jgi:hypothetical protein